MSVQELSRDQLTCLKQAYQTERLDAQRGSPSWGELAEADDIISDESVFDEYEGVVFTPDDFFC